MFVHHFLVMQQLGRHFAQYCYVSVMMGQEKKSGCHKSEQDAAIKSRGHYACQLFQCGQPIIGRVTSQLLYDIAAILPDECNLPPPLTPRPTSVQQKRRGTEKQDT